MLSPVSTSQSLITESPCIVDADCSVVPCAVSMMSQPQPTPDNVFSVLASVIVAMIGKPESPYCCMTIGSPFMLAFSPPPWYSAASEEEGQSLQGGLPGASHPAG